MENLKRDFDKAAAAWDEEPRRLKLASDVADSIAEKIQLNSSMDVLDFGCGTGLLTLKLQPLVRSATGVDSSQGMLDILKAKVKCLGITNVETLYRDLDKGDVLNGSFHLVTSCMTFHHVKDIQKLLNTFHKIILPDGYVAVADLDLDDGRFHEDSTGVFHHGFDRDLLQQNFAEAGFGDVSCRTATSVFKPTANGCSREFTIFLMTGRKTH
jgi:ubiquinone/menaquinone biosynthesis C-methylase UbiE